MGILPMIHGLEARATSMVHGLEARATSMVHGLEARATSLPCLVGKGHPLAQGLAAKRAAILQAAPRACQNILPCREAGVAGRGPWFAGRGGRRRGAGNPFARGPRMCYSLSVGGAFRTRREAQGTRGPRLACSCFAARQRPCFAARHRAAGQD